MSRAKTSRPPLPRPASPGRHTLSYQLREVIDARGLTAYAVGRLAGVDPGVISRFLDGRRDIRMGTADRIASSLGLRLVEVARKGRPGGRASAPAPAVPGCEVEPSGPDEARVGSGPPA